MNSPAGWAYARSDGELDHEAGHRSEHRSPVRGEPEPPDTVDVRVPRHLVPVVTQVVGALVEPEVDPQPAVPLDRVEGSDWDQRSTLLLAVTCNQHTAQILDILAEAGGTEVEVSDIAKAMGRSGHGVGALVGGLTTHVRSWYGDRPSPVLRRMTGVHPDRHHWWSVETSFARHWLAAREELTRPAR